jgi:hypothetical protein
MPRRIRDQHHALVIVQHREVVEISAHMAPGTVERLHPEPLERGGRAREQGALDDLGPLQVEADGLGLLREGLAEIRHLLQLECK